MLGSVQRGSEPAARAAGQVAVRTQLIKDAHDDLADVVLGPVGVWEDVEQQVERLRMIARVQFRERAGQIGGVAVLFELNVGGQAVRLEAAGDPPQDLQRLIVLPTRMEDLGQRNRCIGPGRFELESRCERGLVTRGDQPVGLRGEQRIEEPIDLRRGLDTDELGDDAALGERLDGGDALDAEGLGQSLVRIGVDLDELDLAAASGDGALEQRPELAARCAPLGPEVDDDGQLLRAVDHGRLEVLFGHVHTIHLRYKALMDSEAFTVEADGVVLAGDDSGDGPTVVLLHGLTATRRYVVMGSSSLQRSGHRVIAYDARGHGHSSGASPTDAYGYPALTTDLEAVLDARGVQRAVLAGVSMGAHTITRLALQHPERVAGLVVITPSFDGSALSTARAAHWDALAGGLRSGGIDGFVDAYDLERVAPAMRDTIVTVIRQRMAQHDDLGAVADALSVVPRSRPFDALDDLRTISVPVTVIASGDAADPEHPQAVAEAYAATIPGAELLLDEPGRSPRAWQGSQVSQAIAGVVNRL